MATQIAQAATEIIDAKTAVVRDVSPENEDELKASLTGQDGSDDGSENEEDPRPGRGLDIDNELELQRITFNWPRWITSDSLLRDEGVAYGMGLRGAGALDPVAIKRKLEAIKGWYSVREAVVNKRIQQLTEELSRVNGEVEETKIELEEINKAIVMASAS